MILLSEVVIHRSDNENIHTFQKMSVLQAKLMLTDRASDVSINQKDMFDNHVIQFK